MRRRGLLGFMAHDIDALCGNDAVDDTPSVYPQAQKDIFDSFTFVF